jgi:hypothetical protein
VVLVVSGVVSHVMRLLVQMYRPALHVGGLLDHEPPVALELDVDR